MHWPKTGATQYHAHYTVRTYRQKSCKSSETHYNVQLGLSDKGRTVKGLVVCNDWDLEPLDLLKCLALSFLKLSQEIWYVWQHFWFPTWIRSSNHHIFEILCEDSNHLPPELPARALTTLPLNFLCILTLKCKKRHKCKFKSDPTMK